MASGWKKAPDSPLMTRTGEIARTMMRVAKTTALRISSEASRITAATLRGLPAARFSRRRRMMFSMSTMASSTTSPRAITNPARIMVLIVAPAT